MEGNYIKLYRSFLEWEWYRNINTKILFLHMLLRANWKEGKFEGKVIPRGSFVSSIPSLSQETDLTQREVRTAIEHLKSTGELTVKSYSRYSVFIVNNYCQYQTIDTQNDRQTTGNRHSNDILTTGNRHSIDSLTTTIEEKKEYKEGKKGKKEEGNKKKKEGTNVPKKKDPQVYYPNDEKLNQAFCDFVEMRKEIKKPMTDRAITLAMNKLQGLATLPFSDTMDNDIAIKILEQSTMFCYQGLFPLKEESQGGKESSKSEWLQKWSDA